MSDKKEIALLLSDLIGDLDIKELTQIHEAQIDLIYAKRHEGAVKHCIAQAKADEAATAVVNTLSDEVIAKITRAIKQSARDLS